MRATYGPFLPSKTRRRSRKAIPRRAAPAVVTLAFLAEAFPRERRALTACRRGLGVQTGYEP